MSLRSILLLPFLLAGPICAQEKPLSLPPGVTMRTAVPFAEGTHGPLLADFYQPAKTGPLPAIVFIHGGGWTGQTRSQLAKVSAVLAGEGYVGMQIDYDLSSAEPGGSDVHFPTALIQCKEAVRWLRAHAAGYHVDPKRIAVVGSSAGGELAALMALTSGDKRFEGAGKYREFSSTVQAAVVYNGVLDLSAFPDESGQKMVTTYLGGPCASLAKACADASPQRQVRGGAPPLYVGHGTVDQTVPYAQFTAFIASLKKAGVPVTTFIAEDGKHTYWNDPRFFQKNIDETLTFLRGALGPEKQ